MRLNNKIRNLGLFVIFCILVVATYVTIHGIYMAASYREYTSIEENDRAKMIVFTVVLLFLCFCLSMCIGIYSIIKLLKKNIALTNKNTTNICNSRFWSHISHEIRTPMNAIVGLSEIAKYSIDDRSKLEECLNNIEKTSEYLLSLINDILDMSKIESKKVELNLEPFKISEIINTVRTVSSTNINAKNIKMYIIKSGDLDEVVIGDQNRTIQILVNLIVNASKFTDVNGKIRFCITSEKVAEDRVKYLFEVTDTGIGIKKEFLEKIFRPFEQADSNISTIYGGSGLGLAICKGYIDMMNGKIYVDSEYGRKTSFYVEIELPLASKTEKEIFELSIENSNSNQLLNTCEKTKSTVQITTEDDICYKKKCILLVDDNEMNLEVTSTMLEYYGYKVITANDGQQAIDVFNNSVMYEFDAILMDIQMPVKNGLEAATEIRALNRIDALEIKIIALTANAFKEDRQSAQEVGMNMHITKPIKMKELKEKLDLLFSEY